MVHRSLVVVVAVFLATAGAGLTALEDPGDGTDAGDEPENATLLPGAGTYNGTLVPPGEADWYKLDPSFQQKARCFEAVVSGNVHAEVTLAATVGLSPAVTRIVEPTLSLDLGLSDTTSLALLGLEPPENTSSVPVSGGSYEFAIRPVVPEDVAGDGGTSEDAGDDRETAVTTEGPCIGGTIEDTGDTDVYLFNASEGENVSLSLTDSTSAPLFVNLTAPSGAELAHVDTGGFAEVSLNETGDWILQTSIPEDAEQTSTDYMIGLTVNGPEPRPCEPSCFVR